MADLNPSAKSEFRARMLVGCLAVVALVAGGAASGIKKAGQTVRKAVTGKDPKPEPNQDPYKYMP